MKIFETFYDWFKSFYGTKLGDFLVGYSCATGEVDGTNWMVVIGLITSIISFGFVVAYYYLPLRGFNHPRTNNWWNWLIIFAIPTIINFFIAAGITLTKLRSGEIGDCLVYEMDEDGNILYQLITEADCWSFGMATAILSAMVFILGTLAIKWWSRNNKYSPFYYF